MPKQTILERAIQNVNEKIAALELAKQHLLEEQKAMQKTKKKPVMRADPDSGHVADPPVPHRKIG